MNQLIKQITHEINNPLAIINEEAGWMQDILSRKERRNCADCDILTHALAEIGRQTARCKKITHNLSQYLSLKQLPGHIYHEINDALDVISKEAEGMKAVLSEKETIEDYGELLNSLLEIAKQARRCKKTSENLAANSKDLYSNDP